MLASAQACFPWQPSFLPLFTLSYSSRYNFCFLLLSELSRNIMRGIALALGGSPYEFEGERAGNAFWVMRLIGYPGVHSANGSNIPKKDIGW